MINIDETPVNLRKTTGYVWVLATHNKVYYVYKESREGAFLKDLLAGFSGVLVSDFFTAYDSLKCRHQKCLVHLMRDINDDLRRHPFRRGTPLHRPRVWSLFGKCRLDD